jgi:hypothetical protein
VRISGASFSSSKSSPTSRSCSRSSPSTSAR